MFIGTLAAAAAAFCASAAFFGSDFKSNDTKCAHGSSAFAGAAEEADELLSPNASHSEPQTVSETTIMGKKRK